MYLSIFLLLSCRSEKILNTKFEFDSNDSVNFCAIRFRDQFDNPQLRMIGINENITVNYLPTAFLIQGNRNNAQPIYLLTDTKKVRLYKYKNGKIEFKNVKNQCDCKLLEELEREFGFAYMGAFVDGALTPVNRSTAAMSEKHKGFKYLYESRSNFVDSLDLKCKISKSLKKRLKYDFKSLYLLSFLIPYYLNIDSLPNNQHFKEILYENKKHVASLLNTKKNEGLFSKRLVYYYNKFLTREFLGTENELKAQWDTAKVVFKGETKNFLMFNLLQKYQLSKYYNPSYLADFRKYNKNESYIKHLDSIAKINNHELNLKELNTPLLDTLLNSASIKDIFQKNPNKIFYIDFWASWCAPCWLEMKKYPELQSDLEKMNVATLFLSIDEDKMSWKDAIQGTETAAYQHYLINKDSPFSTFFELSSVPRYAIIGKDMKVINYNAPHPSEKEALIEALKFALKKF